MCSFKCCRCTFPRSYLMDTPRTCRLFWIISRSTLWMIWEHKTMIKRRRLLPDNFANSCFECQALSWWISTLRSQWKWKVPRLCPRPWVRPKRWVVRNWLLCKLSRNNPWGTCSRMIKINRAALWTTLWTKAREEALEACYPLLNQVPKPSNNQVLGRETCQATGQMRNNLSIYSHRENCKNTNNWFQLA